MTARSKAIGAELRRRDRERVPAAGAGGVEFIAETLVADGAVPASALVASLFGGGRSNVNDVSDVKPVGDGTVIEHHETTGTVDVNRTPNDTLTARWQFDAYTLSERRQVLSVVLRDVIWERIEFFQYERKHFRWVSDSVERARAVGCPSNVETQPDNDRVCAERSLGQNPCNFTTVEQYVIGPLETHG